MMTNMEVVYNCAKFVMTAAATKGAKIIADEVIEQFTPENLDNTKKICVEVAKWGGATAFGAVCAKSIGDKFEQGKECFVAVKKFVNVVGEELSKKDADPVVKDTEENNIVEIDDPELVEEEE